MQVQSCNKNTEYAFCLYPQSFWAIMILFVPGLIWKGHQYFVLQCATLSPLNIKDEVFFQSNKETSFSFFPTFTTKYTRAKRSGFCQKHQNPHLQNRFPSLWVKVGARGDERARVNPLTPSVSNGHPSLSIKIQPPSPVLIFLKCEPIKLKRVEIHLSVNIFFHLSKYLNSQ